MKKQIAQKENEIILDGNMVPLGRIGTVAAKKALQGNKVIIINSEKIIIIGNPKKIIEKRLDRIALGKGNPRKPIFPREVIPFIKRSIRGMLNYNKTTGREALKRIICYEGTPKEFEGKETMKFILKKPLNYINIQELSKILRQK